MIPKNTIDEIFETVKIEEVISDFITLKKRGINLLLNIINKFGFFSWCE